MLHMSGAQICGDGWQKRSWFFLYREIKGSNSDNSQADRWVGVWAEDTCPPPCLHGLCIPDLGSTDREIRICHRSDVSVTESVHLYSTGSALCAVQWTWSGISTWSSAGIRAGKPINISSQAVLQRRIICNRSNKRSHIQHAEHCVEHAYHHCLCTHRLKSHTHTQYTNLTVPELSNC